MLSPRGLGESHVLVHAGELGFPPGPAEPTFRAASQLCPTAHPQAAPSHGEQNSAHTVEEACPVPRPRGITQLPQVFSPWDEEGSEDSLLQPPNQLSEAQFPTFRETARLLSPVPAPLSPIPYPL